MIFKNLEEILKSYLNDENQEMTTQIQFIINQINSNKKQEEVDSDNEEEEDDEVNNTRKNKI